MTAISGTKYMDEADDVWDVVESAGTPVYPNLKNDAPKARVGAS